MPFPTSPLRFLLGFRLLNGDDVQSLSDSVLSSAKAIVAFAGGGQASATPLTAAKNVVGTTATVADSVLLPSGFVGGQEVWVYNAGVAALAVFPAGSDTINALAAATAFSVPAGGSCIFFLVTPRPTNTGAGMWASNLSA